MEQLITVIQPPNQNVKNEKYKKAIRIYVVPIVSIVAFVSIIIFFVIPQINYLMKSLDEIDSLNIELTEQKDKLTSIKALVQKQDEISSDLEVIDSIAPSGQTEVVNFGEKIYELANNNNLNVTRQQISDSSSIGSVTELGGNSSISDPVKLLEVPVNFEMDGSFSNIMNFIIDISSIDDFVIINDFTLAGNLEDQWNFKLTFSKYQFDEDKEKSNLSYSKISPKATLDAEIKEYINNRVFKSISQ